MSASLRPRRHRFRNTFCLLVLSGAFGFLVLKSGPEPIGVGEGVAQAKLPVLSISDSADRGSGEADSRTAMQLKIMMLKQAIRKLEAASGYTATFAKQERIAGKLTKLQLMDLKLRHQPFSIYMKWRIGNDKGREVLYVDGANDGELVVNPGGWKSKVVSALKIDPNGSVALAEARHPITNAGMLNLARRVLRERQVDLAERRPVGCRLVESQKFGDRQCHCFVTTFRDREVSETYRKSVLYLDEKTLLPVCIRNYGWPENDSETSLSAAKLDEQTLIENYAYSNVTFDKPLGDRDFDQANAEYRFKR